MNDHRIAALEQEVQRLRNLVPVRIAATPPPANSVLVARIIGGNSIAPASVAGIKYINDDFDDVGTVINPYANPSLQDGLGYGYLYRNDIQQFVDLGSGLVPQRVLISNRLTAIYACIIVGEFVLLGATETIPGAGGNSAYRIAGY